jgi:acyl-CoA synthetase (AMP-forming)/AMP-acid ligase II
MAWDGDRGELQRILARLFGDVPRSKLVLAGAGVDTGLIDFKAPRYVEFGPLPRTSTGKVQKYILHEQEWQGHEKRIN